MSTSSPTWPQVIENERLSDSLAEVDGRRLAALEEALVSRKARRRVRREVRESARRFAWAADSFYGRRLEAVTNAWLSR